MILGRYSTRGGGIYLWREPYINSLHITRRKYIYFSSKIWLGALKPEFLLKINLRHISPCKKGYSLASPIDSCSIIWKLYYSVSVHNTSKSVNISWSRSVYQIVWAALFLLFLLQQVLMMMMMMMINWRVICYVYWSDIRPLLHLLLLLLLLLLIRLAMTP